MVDKPTTDTSKSEKKAPVVQKKALPYCPPGCMLIRLKDGGPVEVKMRATAEAMVANGSAEIVESEGKV